MIELFEFITLLLVGFACYVVFFLSIKWFDKI